MEICIFLSRGKCKKTSVASRHICTKILWLQIPLAKWKRTPQIFRLAPRQELFRARGSFAGEISAFRNNRRDRNNRRRESRIFSFFGMQRRARDTKYKQS